MRSLFFDPAALTLFSAPRLAAYPIPPSPFPRRPQHTQEARAAQRLQLVEAEAAERAARGQQPVNERVRRWAAGEEGPRCGLQREEVGNAGRGQEGMLTPGPPGCSRPALPRAELPPSTLPLAPPPFPLRLGINTSFHPAGCSLAAPPLRSWSCSGRSRWGEGRRVAGAGGQTRCWCVARVRGRELGRGWHTGGERKGEGVGQARVSGWQGRGQSEGQDEGHVEGWRRCACEW